jgi:hypothetical protein
MQLILCNNSFLGYSSNSILFLPKKKETQNSVVLNDIVLLLPLDVQHGKRSFFFLKKKTDFSCILSLSPNLTKPRHNPYLLYVPCHHNETGWQTMPRPLYPALG